jgi:hypothetical protein
VVVDDTLHFSSEYGLERAEVAEALADDSYRRSGFAATIPSDALAPGRHVVSIKILAADRQSYYEPAKRVELELR